MLRQTDRQVIVFRLKNSQKKLLLEAVTGKTREVVRVFPVRF